MTKKIGYEEKKFSEDDILLLLARYPDGVTPNMILKDLGKKWETLTRKESQRFASTLGRLYRKRQALSIHVYVKFVIDRKLDYEVDEKSHHTRLIFHKQSEDRFNQVKLDYEKWLETQPIPTKPYSIGRKYGQRALPAVTSEPTTYQPRAVSEAVLGVKREPTPDEQKSILLEMFDHGCLTPSSGVYPREIAKWTRLDDDLVLRVLQIGNQPHMEEDKIFDQDIEKRSWFLTPKGKQRVAELRFGSIDFMLDETVAGICLNKWNRKAVQFLAPGKTVEELAMTIGYVWDNPTILPEVARRYCVEEISRMLKILKRYQLIEIEEHELLPGMTRIVRIVDKERLYYVRYLAICIEHLHSLFVEDSKSVSLIRSLVPKNLAIAENGGKSSFNSLSELLKTGYFASPTPLQLVTKYIPNLTQPDAGSLRKMVDVFEETAKELQENTPYTIKKIGSQNWLLSKVEEKR
jgi:hypothetical protein